jgi:hypothetical protein
MSIDTRPSAPVKEPTLRRPCDAGAATAREVAGRERETEFEQTGDPAGRAILEDDPELVVARDRVAQVPGRGEVVAVVRGEPPRLGGQTGEEPGERLRVGMDEWPEDDLHALGRPDTTGQGERGLGDLRSVSIRP